MVRKARRSAKRKEKSSPRLRSDVAGVEELRRLGVEAPRVSRLDLRELILSAGIASLQQMMQEELEALCGSRYARKDGDEVASRWGSQGSIVVLGGQKLKVAKPRARLGGREVELPTWAAVQCEDPLNERVVEQMTVGVSTRKYRRSVEFSDEGVGTSKSEVSRRFIAMTQARMDRLLSAPLPKVDWVAIMIDGIEFADHIVLVVLGIDSDGNKHVLGIREGTTENASVCASLLSDVVGRGFPADKNILIVIDGGKGIRSAARKVFGKQGQIQRCTVHKKRNVLEHLPEARRPSVIAAMNEAYSKANAETAEKLLNNLARSLDKAHPGAAASLREGLSETLTVQRLGVHQDLARSLSTTNAIENLNGTIRHISRRVKRWRNGNMVLRWVATGIFEAANGFRRLRGCKQMATLVEGLRRLDSSNDGLHVADVA